MRNISFSLTTPQFRARSKSVTRRLGWLTVKPGDRLMGCEKCRGLKPGEPLVRLGEIEVLNVRREPLRRMAEDVDYGEAECIREGFPDLEPWEFVVMFIDSHKGCAPETTVTRIEFRYV